MRIAVTLAACAVVGVLGGLWFVYSGVYNVAATVPHGEAVYWLTTTTMENSIRNRARNIAVPPLSDEAKIRKGLRAFQIDCVSCHGAPGRAPGQIGRGLNPLPPDLSRAVANWDAAELF